jgi:predicted amidohydrolase YtcJ
MTRVAGGLLMMILGCGNDRQADLVVVGALRTMNPSAPVAEAMAIAGGKILFVGDAQHARALRGGHGRTIALAPGQMVMPGLVDSHVHMLEAGVLQLRCAVDNPKKPEALFDAIAACAAADPDLEWVLGSGWPLSLFDKRGPRKEQLDALIPDRPALFYGEDGHSAWLNSAALRAADIGPKTLDPPRGRIERVDPVTKVPSGTLRETAVDLVEKYIPPTEPGTYREGLEIAQRLLHSLGITLIQDANVTRRVLEAYHEAARSGALTMKVVAAQATDPSMSASQVDELVDRRDRFTHGRLSASTAKLFLDGVMEARTAALLEPYDESPAGADDRGIPNWSAEQLAEIATRLDAAGFQLHMHAIGDAAVRLGLDALAAVRAANGASDLRHQMAHLELVDPADIPRLAELGVFANFQPFWMFADASITESTEPLIGAERTGRLYSIRSFEKTGARIVAGSDWPVSTPNPFLAIEVGITRQDPTDPSRPPWNPDQRVSLDTLLAAYTIQGAIVNHREAETGSLEVGKAADFIILDRNLFEVSPDQIGETRVLATFVDGVQVHASNGEPAAAARGPLARKSLHPLAGGCSCAKHLQRARAATRGTEYSGPLLALR